MSRQENQGQRKRHELADRSGMADSAVSVGKYPITQEHDY